MANDVVFRRIGGRVVPIRINGKDHNDSTKSLVHGSVLAAAGLGVATAGGKVSADLHRSAAHLNNTSRNVGRSLQKRGFGVRTRMEGIRHNIAGTRVKRGAAAVGATLIGAGVHKSLSNTNLSETEKATIASGAAVGSHFALRSAYNKTLGLMTTKSAMKHAFKRILVRGTKI